jgi:hypothetical protein
MLPKIAMDAETEAKTGSSDSSSDISHSSSSYETGNSASLRVASLVDQAVVFVRTHEDLMDNIQSLFLIRRPLEMGLLLAVINCLFLIYRLASLPFFALCVAILIVAHVTFLASPFIMRTAKAHLFRGRLPRGGHDDPSRIRDPNELAAIVAPPALALGWSIEIIRALAADETREGRLIWAAILAWLCILTAAVDWFWLLVVAVNAAVVGPGIWFHPQIVSWRLKLFGGHLTPSAAN